MQSPNKKAMSVAEQAYVAIVASLPCSVCDLPGPSEVHEEAQGNWFSACALCTSCHRGSLLGWHGQKRAFLLRKLSILDVIAITVRRVFEITNPTPAQKIRARAAINKGAS